MACKTTMLLGYRVETDSLVSAANKWPSVKNSVLALSMIENRVMTGTLTLKKPSRIGDLPAELFEMIRECVFSGQNFKFRWMRCDCGERNCWYDLSDFDDFYDEDSDSDSDYAWEARFEERMHSPDSRSEMSKKIDLFLQDFGLAKFLAADFENRDESRDHHSLVGVPLNLHSSVSKKQTSKTSKEKTVKMLNQNAVALSVEQHSESPGFDTVSFDPTMCMRLQDRFSARLIRWAKNPAVKVIPSKAFVTDTEGKDDARRAFGKGRPEWMIASYISYAF